MVRVLGENGFDPGREEEIRRFFESYREFFQMYGQSLGLKVEITQNPQVPTMAIDQEKGKIYVNPDFFLNRGLSQEQGVFGSLHEITHFLQHVRLLREETGDRIWREHQAKIKASRRYQSLDNCRLDMPTNAELLETAPVLEEAKGKLYREILFADPDLTKLPKHLQFHYAILREQMLPAEVCGVAEEVRAEINGLKGIKNSAGLSVLDALADHRVPMATQIALQDQYLDPVSLKLFEKDVKEQEGQDGEEPPSEPGKEGTKPAQHTADKEKYFENHYQDFENRHPSASIKPDDWDKILRDYKGFEQNRQQAEAEARARELGVTAKEQRDYQNFWQRHCQSLESPEADLTLVEYLRKLFKKLTTERLKPRIRYKGPVEDGEKIADWHGAYVAAVTGQQEAPIWEAPRVRESKEQTYARLRLRFLFDLSTSMREGQKALDQKKCGMVLLEMCDEWQNENDELAGAGRLAQNLEVWTQVWSFGDAKNTKELKPLSPRLSEKTRVALFKELDKTVGVATMDYRALQAVLSSVIEEDIEAIAKGELKDIVVVVSDGVSFDGQKIMSVETKKQLRLLRGKGIKIIPVIISCGKEADDQMALDTYAPEGRLCKQTKDLGAIVAEALEKEL